MQSSRQGSVQWWKWSRRVDGDLKSTARRVDIRLHCYVLKAPGLRQLATPTQDPPVRNADRLAPQRGLVGASSAMNRLSADVIVDNFSVSE